MALTFDYDEPIPDGVRRILRVRLDENIRLLTEPTDDLDTAVHDARKNCKRMRAVLRLIRFEIGDAAYRWANETIRDASRLLAPMRDGWVMVKTLDALAEDPRVPQEVAAAVRTELQTAYQRVRTAFLEDPDVLPTAVAMFEQVRGEVPAFSFRHSTFGVLARGLRRTYRRGRRDYKRAFPVHNAPELYHDWRKRVKYLWYQLETLQPVWPDVVGATIAELKRIAKPLGEAHDLVVLRDTLRARPERYGDAATLAPLLDLLAERQDALEAAAAPGGRRIYAEAPEAFVQRMAHYWDAWTSTGSPGASTKAVAAPDLLSTHTAANQLGVTSSTIRRWIRQGRLPARKVGTAWVLDARDVEK